MVVLHPCGVDWIQSQKDTDIIFTAEAQSLCTSAVKI